MVQAEKYQFDVEFDASGQILRSPTEINAFSLDEVEQIKAQAFEEGRESETARAANIASDALTQIAQTTMAMTDQLNTQALLNKKAAFDLALTAARKIAGSALASFPFAEIEATIEDCLAELSDASRLVVSVPESLLDMVATKIQDIAEQQNFEGRLRVVADGDMPPHDCKVEWGDGGLERQTQYIEDKIAEIVARRLMSEAADIGQLDLFADPVSNEHMLAATE